ncbi:MAG: hypothetical protein R2873_02650 [Caldilineaceae bacterium]
MCFDSAWHASSTVAAKTGNVEIVHGLGFVLRNGFEKTYAILFLELLHRLALFECFFEIARRFGGFSVSFHHRFLRLDRQIEGGQVAVVMLDFVNMQHALQHLFELSGKTLCCSRKASRPSISTRQALRIRQMTLPIFYNALPIIEDGLETEV